MSDTSAYLLRWRGRQSGPCTLQEINRKLDDHEIGMTHEIQYQDRWISVQEFLRLQAVPPPAANPPAVTSPPPLPRTPGGAVAVPPPIAPAPVATVNSSPCRRLIFAGLAILLGFLGVHNFYARHWLTGVIQLLVSVASLLLGFGVIAPWLWAMVEAVLVRRDGYEREMT